MTKIDLTDAQLENFFRQMKNDAIGFENLQQFMTDLNRAGS